MQGARFVLSRPARRTTVVVEASKQDELREKRHKRIRGKVQGTEERPRMVVHRTNQHLYVQVVNDKASHTLAATSTLAKNLRETCANPNIEAAKAVGVEIARICKEKGITTVKFDRAGYRYHGRIQVLADAAREGGLDF